jgi:hypothetical protein
MVSGKAAVLAAAIVGGAVFGAWLGPYRSNSAQAVSERTALMISRPAISSTPVILAIDPATDGQGDPAGAVTFKSMPELQKRLKPLLNRNTDIEAAAAGFRDVEGFAAALHASKNIRMPFAALKHQIVDEGKPLAAAIRVVKPTADASLEADLARSEARSDLAALK